MWTGSTGRWRSWGRKLSWVSLCSWRIATGASGKCRLLALGVCALAWRFYFTGPPPMDAATILRGWEAFAAGGNPYSADFGVNYPPAMQWSGGLVTAAAGSTCALAAYRFALVVGCVLGLLGIARLAAIPAWAVVAIGSASCVPMLEGLAIGNPGPAIAGLGIWALATRRHQAFGLSLACKPLLAPAWIAIWVWDRIAAELAALVAFAVTVPAIGLVPSWLTRVHEWEPVWATATGREPFFPMIPGGLRMLVVGLALGIAGRRWMLARRPEVLCAGSFLALPVLWDHSQVLLMPALLSGSAWVVRQSRMRRFVWLLVASMAMSFWVPTPARAGWTKQANGQWTGLSYLHCLVWSTNGTYCYDEYASSATNELVRVLPDYTAALYNGPPFPATYGMAVGLGTSSAGLHFVYNEADCKIASYYTSSATAASWTQSFIHLDRQGGGVILGPAWGPSSVLVAPTLNTGFNPARLYPIRWTTGAPTDGGYQNGMSNIYCNTRTIGSGCPRDASYSDWLLGWSSDVQFKFAYGSINTAYNEYTTPTQVTMSGKIDASSGCASDGSTSIIGVRRVSAGQSYLVQQGAVTTSQQYSTDLIVGYAGTAFTGSSARFAISVDGAMWTATSGAFADASGTSLDITLDASDKVSGFALAPDGTTPMVVTKEGDVFTFALDAASGGSPAKQAPPFRALPFRFPEMP